MKTRIRKHPLQRLTALRSAGLVLALGVAFSVGARAQRPPHIGYLYPAGGQAGSSFELLVGGQHLGTAFDAIISGKGVTVEVLDCQKPPKQQAVNEMRKTLKELRPKLRKLKNDKPTDLAGMVRTLLAEQDLTASDLRGLAAFERYRKDPKRQPNPQLSESVRMRVTISSQAEPGIRHWRLRTTAGLSNPMRFVVGQQAEIREATTDEQFDLLRFLALQDNSDPSRPPSPTKLPITINGQILPGEVDQFSFPARKGEAIVVALQARELIPYLADAVPGWFQAIVALHDSAGKEIAFADDYQLHPDPVLFFKIPSDGDYRISVRDSIYRGREDFVYRLTIGQLPFITSLSPRGGQADSEVALKFTGGNLADHTTKRFPVPVTPGITGVSTTVGRWQSNSVPFHVDTFPEAVEHESNDTQMGAQEIDPPGIVNGVISRPGDVDFFRVRGRGNQPMTFEIFARRLGSPLDATITVFDMDDQQIGFNDDFKNPAAGLTTHHADSRLTMTLPKTGKCLVRVGDAQHQGGSSYSYRLRVLQTMPSFALRVTPSSINISPDGTARVIVHALRMDGFDGEIALSIRSPDNGFALKNATVPAGKDRAYVTLAAPPECLVAPAALTIQGSAEVEGKPVVVEAVAADDQMQAFLNRHLVPADVLLVDVRHDPNKKEIHIVR